MTQYPPPGAPPDPPPGYGTPPPPPGYAPPPPGAYPPPYAGPPVHQPGVVPLRPLTLGDIFGGSITTIRRNLGATVGLSALVLLAFMLVPIVVTALGGLAGGLPSLDSMVGDDELGSSLLIDAASIVSSLFKALATIVVTGMLIRVVEAAVSGEKITAREAWRRARGRLWRLVGLTLLVGALTVLVFALPVAAGFGVYAATQSGPFGVLVGVAGELLAVPAVIFLYVRFVLLAAPNLVLEQNGVFASLGRAGRLSRGQFWRLFGISLLAGIVAAIAGSIVSIPFALIGAVLLAVWHGSAAGMTVYLLSTYVASVLAGALVTPFTGGVSALQYFDQRFRKEGHDIELLERSLGRVRT